MKAVFRKECRHQLLSFKSIFFVLLFIVLGVSLEQLFSAVSIDIGGIDNKLLLSTVVKRGAASNFLGLAVSIALPFIGLYTMAKNSFLRFLFPYSYIFNLDWNTLVPVMLSAIIVGIAVAIFKRMDL